MNLVYLLNQYLSVKVKFAFILSYVCILKKGYFRLDFIPSKSVFLLKKILKIFIMPNIHLTVYAVFERSQVLYNLTCNKKI